jgi:hypothetical protein
MWRYRNAAHYLVGVLVAMSSLVNWVLPLTGIIFFLTYELDEDWHLYDQAYRDILEAMIGFFIAVSGIIIWRLA